MPLLPPVTRRPDVERIYRHLTALFSPAQPPDPTLSPIAAARQTIGRYPEVGPRVSYDDVEFIAVSAGGVAAEWVVPKGASERQRIVYLHGGGWALATPKDYRIITATLARLSGACVLVVDYRLAPEHPFPAGLDDCVRALDWAFDNGPEGFEERGPKGREETGPGSREEKRAGSGAHTCSVSLVGDSAGGNLGAATCLAVIAASLRLPQALVLISPLLDVVPNPSRVGRDDPVCTEAAIAHAFERYTGGSVPPTDPRISPVYAADDVLRRFPPTLIQAGGPETLLYDSKAFARRLEDCGVRVALSMWPDMPHVWHIFLGLLPEGTQALQEIAAFVGRGGEG
jgi:acetyl esterase/lipase